MRESKWIKIAAVISLSLLSLWLVLTILSYLFQEQAIDRLFYGTGVENIPKFFLFSHAVQLAACAAVIIANIFVLKNKGRLAPLWIVLISSAAVPLLSTILYRRQAIIVLESRVDSGLDYSFLSAFNNVNTELMYILYMAAVVSITACAVYACSKKIPSEEIPEKE